MMFRSSSQPVLAHMNHNVSTNGKETNIMVVSRPGSNYTHKAHAPTRPSEHRYQSIRNALHRQVPPSTAGSSTTTGGASRRNSVAENYGKRKRKKSKKTSYMTPPPVTNFRYQHQWRDGRIVKVPINSKGRSMEFTTKANDRVTRDPLDFGRMKGRAELDRLERYKTMGSINRSDNKLFTEFAESYAISKHKRSIAIKYSEAVRARAKSVRNIPLGRQMLSKEEIEDDRRVEVEKALKKQDTLIKKKRIAKSASTSKKRRKKRSKTKKAGNEGSDEDSDEDSDEHSDEDSDEDSDEEESGDEYLSIMDKGQGAKLTTDVKIDVNEEGEATVAISITIAPSSLELRANINEMEKNRRLRLEKEEKKKKTKEEHERLRLEEEEKKEKAKEEQKRLKLEKEEKKKKAKEEHERLKIAEEEKKEKAKEEQKRLKLEKEKKKKKAKEEQKRLRLEKEKKKKKAKEEQERLKIAEEEKKKKAKEEQKRLRLEKEKKEKKASEIEEERLRLEDEEEEERRKKILDSKKKVEEEVRRDKIEQEERLRKEQDTDAIEIPETPNTRASRSLDKSIGPSHLRIVAASDITSDMHIHQLNFVCKQARADLGRFGRLIVTVSGMRPSSLGLIEKLNAVPVDYMCLSNHPGDLRMFRDMKKAEEKKYADLKAQLQAFKGTVLNTNLADLFGDDYPSLKSHDIITVNKRRFAFLGFVGSDADNEGGIPEHQYDTFCTVHGNTELKSHVSPSVEAGEVWGDHMMEEMNCVMAIPLTYQPLLFDRDLSKLEMYPIILGGLDQTESGLYHKRGTCITKVGPNAERVAIIDVEWSTTGHKSLNVEVVNTDIQSQEHGFSIHKGVRDHDNEGGHYDMDGFSIDSHNHIARDKNFKFQVRLPTPPEKKKPVSTTEFNEMRENLKRLETEKHNMKAEMEAKLADQIKTMEAGIHEKIMRQITQQIMAGGIVDKVDSRSNAQTPLPRIHEGEDKSRNQDQSQNQNPSSTRDRGTQGLEGTSVDARELQTGRSTSSKGNGHKSSRSHQSRRRSSKKQRTRLSVASVPKELRCLGCDATDEAVLFTCTKCPRGMHPNFCIKKTCWHSKHPKEVSRMNECHNCTKQLDVTAHKESLSQHVGVFRCPQCKSVYYCSRECQVEHWKAGHYEECATLRLSRKDLKHKRALLPGRTRPSLPSEEEKKTLTPKEIEEMMENLYIDDAEKNLYQNLTRMKNAARGRGVTNTVLSRLQESQLKEKMKSQLAAAKRASISGTLISSTVLMSQLAATIKKGSSDSTMGDSSNRSEATTSFRPGTGSALRPSTGSVTRPETGSLARPSTGSILRPTTGSAASTDSTGSVTEGHVDTTGVDMSIATSVAKPVAGICADEEVALSADEKRRSDLKAKIANMTQEEKEKYRKLLIHERENKRREKVAQKHLRKRKSSMKDKKNKKKEIKRTASIKKRSIKKNMTTKEKKILEEAASKEAAEQDRKKQIAQRQSQRRASLSMSIEDARLEKLRKEQARKAKIKHKAENARKQAEAIIAKGMKEEQEKQDRMKIRRQSRSGRRSGAGSRSSTPSYSRGSTPAQRGSTPLTRGSTPLSARPEKMKDVNYMNGNEGRGGSNIEFIEPINEESPSDDLEEFLRLEAELVEEGQK